MKAMETTRSGRTALPFDRQRREGSKAFAAFQIYLELGKNRTHALVAEKLGVSTRMVNKWGVKHGWTERIAARDAYLAEVERRAIERVAIEKAVEWWRVHEPTRRLAWQKAEKAIAMVDKAFERWEKSGRAVGFEGMARMLELAFKLKQFAAGMPSEIKETHTHVTGKVSVEWEAAIRKAYGVATPPVTIEPPAAVVDVEEVRKPEDGVRNESQSLVTPAATEGEP